jgi:hypothetical protein
MSKSLISQAVFSLGQLIGNQVPPLDRAQGARAPADPRGGTPRVASLPLPVRPSDFSEDLA